jgi:hypothetical protein
MECEVLIDGSNPNLWNFHVPQQPNTINIPTDKEPVTTETLIYPKATVLMSGILWILSMFSYIGGNWYVSMIMIIIPFFFFFFGSIIPY